jgi:hypothetical protein
VTGQHSLQGLICKENKDDDIIIVAIVINSVFIDNFIFYFII